MADDTGNDGIDRRRALSRIGAAATAGITGIAGFQYFTRPVFAIDAESLSAADVDIASDDGRIEVTDPATTDAAAAPDPPTFDSYRVVAVADLNGDGIMEVAVHTWNDDGAGMIVYEYDGDEMTEALDTGCGI